MVHDSVIHRDHQNTDVVLQKVYQHISGYHTDDHTDDLQNGTAWRRTTVSFHIFVTNMELTSKNIHQFYFRLGHMENVIKEAKTDLLAINAVKLQVAMLAYNFNNWFRRICLPEKMKPSRMETLRTKLSK